MYGVTKLSDFHVEERWKKNRTYENMKALIGQKAGGAPCYLDVHEKYHGPHGLVAGTTGSGKSETLQTYMLSLAINFSPDDIGFLSLTTKAAVWRTFSMDYLIFWDRYPTCLEIRYTGRWYLLRVKINVDSVYSMKMGLITLMPIQPCTKWRSRAAGSALVYHYR